MASIANDPGGRRRIQFVDTDGKRRPIRLGKMSLRDAEGIARHVEALLVAKRSGQPLASRTAAWLGEIGDDLHARIAAVGLVAPREAPPTATLGPFLTEYIASRTDVKPLTTRHLNDAKRNLIAFFGEDKPLADISPGDGDEFRRYLLRELGENTVRRKCGRAKQFFRAALRKRLIRENPFADMKGCTVQANRSRDYFVTREEAARVLDACPDAEWRLIFALSRFGGLRCPSEHLVLRWGDVDWERDRIRVRSPKTEHFEGRDSRSIPIFAELRPHLEQAWDAAGEGAEFVINRYRTANANLRTRLERIIGKAGLEPWPKLFHNLRATRETELAQTFPLHVVCEWIGNSQAVAAKHYLQVTEDHFREAAGPAAGAAQNPAQHAHAGSGGESQSSTTAQKQSPVLPGFANRCDIVQICSVPPEGLEPSTL